MPAFLMAFLARYAGILIAGAAALALILGAWLWVRHLQAEVAQAKAQAAVSRAATLSQTAKANTAAGVPVIIQQAARRDALTITLHQANAHAIADAPGASAPIDPALNRAGRAGLCRYAAEHDQPGCVQLLGPHPAGVAQPDAGSGPPS